jgi:hypothetical protein
VLSSCPLVLRWKGSPMSTIEQLWQDLIDKDDRNSPEEHPDMALITFDEFRDAILAARNRANLGAKCDEREPPH